MGVLEEADIATRFAWVRSKSTLNRKQFAESIDIAPTIVSDVESAKREPSKDVLIKLAERHGISIHWMLTGKGPKFSREFAGAGSQLQVAGDYSSETQDTRERGLEIIHQQDALKNEGAFVVPLLDQQLSAGPGADLAEADTVVGYIEVPRALRRFGNNIAALSVSGDSMEPTLYDGDMVLCDKLGWDGDGVYAVRLDGHGLVKRLAKRPGAVMVISDNPKYSPFEARPEEIEVVGRARYGMRKM